MIQFMRFWDKTSFYVRLIQETLKDAMWFLLIYLNILAAVAVAIYMLNQTRGYHDEESSIIPEMLGNQITDALLATYMQSMG